MSKRSDEFQPLTRTDLVGEYISGTKIDGCLKNDERIELQFPDGTVVPCTVVRQVRENEYVRGHPTYYATYFGTIEIFGGTAAIVLTTGMPARRVDRT